MAPKCHTYYDADDIAKMFVASGSCGGLDIFSAFTPVLTQRTPKWFDALHKIVTLEGGEVYYLDRQHYSLVELPPSLLPVSACFPCSTLLRLASAVQTVKRHL